MEGKKKQSSIVDSVVDIALSVPFLCNGGQF